ncbi:hypothetical protein GCM10009819_22510 [Agromyces tropicus]|uniref:Uncharacterized protein n=1 Tax=Agromyces tropicus TaxID=555371 RepID=A0ABN2UP51_9MICO
MFEARELGDPVVAHDVRERVRQVGDGRTEISHLRTVGAAIRVRAESVALDEARGSNGRGCCASRQSDPPTRGGPARPPGREWNAAHRVGLHQGSSASAVGPSEEDV